MKHIFIINPIAGKKDLEIHLKKEIRKLYKEMDYVFEITASKGHATKIAEQYASTGEEVRIYACGGDGTLNEVVNGMYQYPNASLAVIPIGTGNDFIKYFADYNIKDFLDVHRLMEGTEIKIDILRCANRACINIASVGFDARVVQNVSKFKRLPFVDGQFAYMLAVFNSFFSSMKFRYKIQIDDEIIHSKDYIFIVMANAKFYGGSFLPTPDASIEDGYLDILTIDSLSRFKVTGLIKVYKQGKHLDYDFVHHQLCKKVKIFSDDDIVLNLDGETLVAKNPEIEVLPKQVRFILPKKNRES